MLEIIDSVVHGGHIWLQSNGRYSVFGCDSGSKEVFLSICNIDGRGGMPLFERYTCGAINERFYFSLCHRHPSYLKMCIMFWNNLTFK